MRNGTCSDNRTVKMFGRRPSDWSATHRQALALALAQTLGVESNRVFLTAYPQAGFSGKGKACETTRQGFDVTAQWELDGKRTAEAEAFVSGTLTPIMRKAAADHQWQFVDAYRTSKIFEDHGVCAKGAAEEPENPVFNDKFPRQRTIDGKTQFDPYDPNQFAPYLQRQRWFRTPNDAFLTVHLHGTEFIPDMALKLTSWTAYGGALHPTAEGQAVMADALYKELSKTMKGAN